MRPYEQKSFLERNRTRFLWLAGLAGVALVGAFVFLSAASPSYACSTPFDPSPSPAPSGSASPRGYVQPDMGNSHNLGSPQRYAFCPPASGPHSATFGPMRPGVYGPDSGAIPQGWIHNLEHGGLVVLYNPDLAPDSGADAGQQRFRQFFNAFPNSPICNFAAGQTGPVIAPFREMPYAYAALVWGRVLPLDTFDEATVLEFFRTHGERTNPENLCPDNPREPSASPAASPSGSPAASPSGSPAGSPSGSPEASPSAS